MSFFELEAEPTTSEKAPIVGSAVFSRLREGRLLGLSKPHSRMLGEGSDAARVDARVKADGAQVNSTCDETANEASADIRWA